MSQHQSSFNSVARTVRLSLSTILDETRVGSVENVRRALQSAGDLVNNVTRNEGRSLPLIDVWQAAEDDFDRIKHNRGLPPPLSVTFADTRSWQNLNSHLLAFDPSWSVWLIWLRFRLMGITSDDIPSALWPKIERKIALMPEAFWQQSEKQICEEFAATIVDVVEENLELEANKEQNPAGLRFSIVEDIKIDVLEERTTETAEIRTTVSNEVVRNATRLLDLCDDNSASLLRSKIEDYLETLNGGVWTDEMLLVMRGDILRKEVIFQENWNEDSDIPPLKPSALQSLVQTVRLHNALVNSHTNLAKADRMLLSPEVTPENSNLSDLRTLLASAAKDRILSDRANVALQDIFLYSDHSPRSIVTSFSASNFIRLIFRYLWNYKKSFTVSGSAVMVASFGKWALANEVLLAKYFSMNPTMSIVVARVFEFLHRLPLL
ncbi:hypothetical protein AAIO73_05045 [Sphingomonas sp. T9W2]